MPTDDTPGAGAAPGDGLNPRRKRFCEEFAKDPASPGAAFLRAGFKAKNSKHAAANACRLLALPAAAAYVAHLQAQVARAVATTRDDIAREMRNLAYSNLGDFIEWKGTTVTLKDSSTIGREKLAQVAEVTMVKGGVRFKLHDKRAALMDLARILGHLGEHAGADDKPTEFRFSVVRPEDVPPDPSATASDDEEGLA